MSKQLNVSTETVLPACLIADVELSLHGGQRSRRLQQDDDDDWDEGISSEWACRRGCGCCRRHSVVSVVLTQGSLPDCWCLNIGEVEQAELSSTLNLASNCLFVAYNNSSSSSSNAGDAHGCK